MLERSEIRVNQTPRIFETIEQTELLVGPGFGSSVSFRPHRPDLLAWLRRNRSGRRDHGPASARRRGLQSAMVARRVRGVTGFAVPTGPWCGRGGWAVWSGPAAGGTFTGDGAFAHRRVWVKLHRSWSAGWGRWRVRAPTRLRGSTGRGRGGDDRPSRS